MQFALNPGMTIIHLLNVKYKNAGERCVVFWEKAGAPPRWARVDIFCLISYTLGAFYSIFEGGSTFIVWYLTLWVHFIQYLKEGRHLFSDFFPLGAFSRRVALFCKPLAFWFGISRLFHWNYIFVWFTKLWNEQFS